MSAPHIVVFLPEGVDGAAIMHRLCADLELEIDRWPPSCADIFSAQRTDSSGMILIRHDSNAVGMIEELCEWERSTAAMKQMLRGCFSKIDVHYRGRPRATRCLQIMAAMLDGRAAESVVENGRGCLLLLSDVVERLAADPSWSWERDEFPELPGVAPSEWRE